MKNKTTLTSVLLTGLLAAAGFAHAQNTGASATSNVPARSGEASSQIQGVPNATPKVGENSRDAVKAETRAANTGNMAAKGTISKGTIGTTDATGQQAGLEAKPTDGKTRAEVKAERQMQKAQKKADKNMAAMSTSGMSTGVPAGNPSPLAGEGTPK